MSVHLAFPRLFSASLIKFCVILTLVLFLFVPAWAGSTEKVLWAFENWRDGAHPWGTLVFDKAGNLYGTTQFGGDPTCGPEGKGGCGTVFRLAPRTDGTWKEQVIHHFTGSPDGAWPYTGVIVDATGNLFGTTASGGGNVGFGDGVVFELSPVVGGWTETLLHTFGSHWGDGLGPQGLLTMDKRGKLYGTTYHGLNPCRYGIVFRLAPNRQGGWTERKLHCFSDPNDGTYPIAGVTLDNAGNLFGTSYLGGDAGTNCCGTAFQLTFSGKSWTENIVHHFSANGGDGVFPVAGLVSDKNGNIYGTTSSGGLFGAGAVYVITPAGGEQIIYNFQGPPDGSGPWVGSLVFDQAGNLYGTTASGGTSTNCRAYGCGTVFKLTHTLNGWQESVIYSFQGGAGGANPYGGLVLDQQGNLFGTTFAGGTHQCRGGCGVVFEIIP
jgi:uncharacterized repeat protein (TIGR03803 family)